MVLTSLFESVSVMRPSPDVGPSTVEIVLWLRGGGPTPRTPRRDEEARGE
jgi:hypothetical protein